MIRLLPLPPLLLLAACLTGCGVADSLRGSPDASAYMEGGAKGDVAACYADVDCPAGLRCDGIACVAADGGAPEVEDQRTFLRPSSSDHYVYALSPEADAVAVIDPVTLAIEPVSLPDEPISLQVLAGTDAAAALSREGRRVSFLSTAGGETTVRTAPTPRRYAAISVSPDGRFAVLWTPDGEPPDAGAEGVIGVLDLAALTRGEPAEVVERAAGRRHTDVAFRTVSGAAVDAILLGKDEVAILDLASLAASPLPVRLALPSDFAEISGREVIPAPDGSYLLLRSLSSSELGVLDVAGRRFSRLELPSPAYDVDVTPDGRLAVAVLRETAQVAWFPLPGALSDPGLIRTTSVQLPATDCDTALCIAAPGQVVLSDDGSHAVLFTNARSTESLAWLDLSSGAAEVLGRLEKQVQTVGIAPDGHTLLVLHRRDQGSTAAEEYERSVDQQEGITVLDTASGALQLQLLGTSAPQELVFSADGLHAAVTLRDDSRRSYAVLDVDLRTLVFRTLELVSAPRFAGALPGGAAIWVTQEHPAGRISFIDLATGAVRTATGFELNSEIERGEP